MSSSEDLERLTDLASRAFGARVLFATDEWFAPAHHLLLPEEPVFIADKFTSFGKWMDGWETRRKRIPGHDWCIIELGLRGTIEAIDVDTAFFTGNNAPRVSIQAARFSGDIASWPRALQQLSTRATVDREMGRCATKDEEELARQLESEKWTEIVPFTELGPGYPETRHNLLRTANHEPWTHLRLNMYPDGGIARLRVYGSVVIDWSRVPATQLVDLVAAENGGQVIHFNDAHYGHPKNLIAPGRSLTMAGGWETARKKTRPSVLVADASGLLEVPGKDWTVLKLGHAGVIHDIEVDTNHFKGNFPESCVIYATSFDATKNNDVDVLSLPDTAWQVLLPRTKLEAHKQHYFSVEDKTVNLLKGGINFVKLEIFPDGGISRLRLRGYKTTTESRL
ncbi:hypothetical protein Poli38472_006704 [Pythium oligandrum]|uniref:Allantoicase domain-containing protein n=1 Tax=Pythium oligandrum TaxID=41045 RepID=A0A8K1C522_PYTOL|nr:hypothetical protein Poli38472_006704 [Pythium oligandrum]|eukprot:TMW56694.1 hypothetical protein Poli38472_006704 [Pythium oligandrum]